MTTMQDRAEAVHAAAQKNFERIRANQNLSDAGKQKEIAKVYSRYRDDIKALGDGVAASRQQRSDSLTRQVFGMPTDPMAQMSYRDALGRAESISDARIAESKLTLALQTGDKLMAQAIAQVSVVSGWTNVLAQYAASDPRIDAALTELDSIASQANSIQNRFVEAASHNPLKPTELANLDDWRIDSLAAE